ncbi:hypothetical protein N7481_006905 [Penicillium waksmanii]|uniref:uncharacterized protein n=1 Tax=Penicillium waksmanii TaxID=69791 RepID=UPI0025480207|nr:uncharacterized protein N7481_006905 [Penicillium waksmanii]KAJ5979607.1 hypothetical protein N7481_006905 [Penicillium waksmanii]
MSSIRRGTAIDACVTAHDRRVYVQDESDWIVELIHSDGKWSQGERLVEAAPGAGFSAVWWDQLGAANSELDLYYVSKDFILSEMCWRKEKGWWKGSLATKSLRLNPQSHIAARVQQTSSTFKTALRLHVVFQMEDNRICHSSYESEWKLSKQDLGYGLPGTSLTSPDHKFQNRASYQPRVFYVKPDGKAAELCADGSGGWWTGNFSTEISEGSKMGGCFDVSGDYVYVYVQNKEDASKIDEWRGGKWKIINSLTLNA